MIRSTITILLAVLTANVTFGQLDCSSQAHWFLYLQSQTAPECSGPLGRYLSDRIIPTASQIATLCRANCVEIIIDFLDMCPNDNDAQDAISFLEDKLCSFQDVNNAGTSCLLLQPSVNQDFRVCLAYWQDNNNQCPTHLVLGVPLTQLTCSQVLQSAVSMFGCCLENLYDEDTLTKTAEQFLGSNVFHYDSVPDLFEACDVNLPPKCVSDTSIDPTTQPTTQATTQPTKQPTQATEQTTETTSGNTQSTANVDNTSSAVYLVTVPFYALLLLALLAI